MRKILKSERGLTLVEVLLTLVITTIVSGVIYSVFTTGLKLYQKIGVVGQLRDDADYVATMILNEMYNNPPNYITKYENGDAKGIELVRYQAKKVDNYIIEDNTTITQDLLIYYENDKFYIEKRDDPVNKNTIEKREISSESTKFTTINDGTTNETSSITYNCTQSDSNGKCQHGTISLNIVIEEKNEALSNLLKTKPLILKSTFGF